MLKNKIALEVKIGERNYILDLSSESPLSEVYEALTQMRSYVVERINTEHQASLKKTEES